MATGGKSPTGKDRVAREARDRTRLYQARASYNEGRLRRRGRDNVLAGVVGGILILGVIGGQIAYYTAGPGKPLPEPTSTPSPTATVPVSPSPTPSPTVTP